jgi:acetoin utilization protein AcuB
MWMTPDPVTVEPSTRVSQAARLMALRHVRRLPVTEPGSHGRTLVGIISSHDVWQACPADFHPLSASAWPASEDPGVGTIMSAALHTTTPDTPIETAARLLRKHKIGALPVTREGRLVGIITESDLLDVLLEMTGANEPGIRVSFEIDDDEDVVRELLDISDRHGMRLASVLSFRHPGDETSAGRRLGVARLLGQEPSALVDEIWARCRRVRRVVRSDPGPGSAGPPAERAPGVAPGRSPESTNR